MITDPTTAELAVTSNDRSIEYYFASDARYIYICFQRFLNNNNNFYCS